MKWIISYLKGKTFFFFDFLNFTAIITAFINLKSKMENQEKIIENLLSKWVSRIIDKEKLEKKLKSGEKLRIKFGIDPTGSSVHIGHAVPILKLREFQKLGHQVIILIWEATAQIWDSSDKTAERPMLTREEVKKNHAAYLDQFGKILDMDKVEVRYNSEWLDKVAFNEVWEIAKNFSVAEMLDRDNFSKRYKGGVRISLQEFLYPLMQGYDSVALEADVELGWNDQLFNLLAGRTIQEAYGQEKQAILAFNLIEGTDGRKMSKSFHNFIGLDFSANDMFVKLMEINDDLIIKYFEHCTTLYTDEIKAFEERMESGENPRNIKLDLAFEITKLYHNEEAATNAKAYFERVLKEGIVPDEKDIEKLELEADELPAVTLIREAKMVWNSTEARNALSSNWVKINNEVVSNPKQMITLSSEEYTLIQVWKKKFKMVKKA